MKLVYLHQYFVTPSMAGATRSYEMARRLVAAGHEVHMITSDQVPAVGRCNWYTTVEQGITVHWLPVPYSNRMPYWDRVRAFLDFAWRAARKAAELGGDVVFATSTPLTIALPAVYAARHNRIPMVFEVRDLWPELPISIGALKNPVAIQAARWLERFAYGHAAHVVALSPGMADGVAATGYPREHISIIPNSCDVDDFTVPASRGEAFRAGEPWLGDRPLVVYAGTFGRINGVDYLARVAAAMVDKAPEVRFLAVGDGHDVALVRKEADRLGVLDRSFYMHASIPKSEMPALLSASTIATSLFIDLKEMWANSANKFFDTLAANRPIAINYGGWQADILRESGAGLVLPADDPEAAAATLARHLDDKAWLTSASVAAGRLARDRFSRDELAAQLERVLIDAART